MLEDEFFKSMICEPFSICYWLKMTTWYSLTWGISARWFYSFTLWDAFTPKVLQHESIPEFKTFSSFTVYRGYEVIAVDIEIIELDKQWDILWSNIDFLEDFVLMIYIEYKNLCNMKQGQTFFIHNWLTRVIF